MTTVDVTRSGNVDEGVVASPVLYWSGPLAIEDAPTGDGRRVMPDALTWRDLPLPLMFQSKTPDGGGNPHAGADWSARIALIWRDESTVYGAGPIDPGAAGADLARFLADGPVGVSVDLDDVDAVMECLESDEFGDCVDGELQLVKGRIMGATCCPFPAIPAAHISLISAEEYAALTTEHTAALAEIIPNLKIPSIAHSLTAAAVLVETMPPESWFQPATFAALTPLTISDEEVGSRRRVYGHIAPRYACHIGYSNECKNPPRGLSYTEFNTKRGATRVACDCGNGDWAEIPTGVITFGTSHMRDLTMPAHQAMDHYERTGMAICDVIAGEDEFGPWVVGATKPGLTNEQIELFRGASISPDWRPIAGVPELIAVLAVNVPGLGVPRTAFHVSGGEVTALIASGMPMQVGGSLQSVTPLMDHPALARAERLMKILEPLALEQIAQRFATPGADLTPKQREDLHGKGQAMPDGSFPIRNRSDLKNAIGAIGRAGPKGSSRYAAVKAWIMRRARELNAEADLPDDWK